jgi:hypothetical protein
VALVRQVEGEPGGVEVCLAHVPRHGAEGAPGFAPRGGRGMAQRRAPDVSCEETSPLGRCAARALDAAAAPGRGRQRPGLVIASARGQEPSGGARGFPGAAQEFQGLMRQGDSAVLGALAAGAVEHVARALALAHLQGQRCVPAQPTARDGGAGDALGQGGGGGEETVHRCQAEESRESVGGRGAHEVAGLPVAPKDVVGEASDGAVADAQGAWSESVTILAG